jgi:hypothetical protein
MILTKYTLLRRFRKFVKKLLLSSSCLSFRSVRMKELGSYSKEFREIWYLSIFRTTVEKIQVSLKTDKDNGYFT